MLAVSGLIFSPVQSYVHANSYQEQINQLNAESAEKTEARSSLQAQASTLEEKISIIAQEISGLETQIEQNKAQRAELNKRIAAAKIELAENRDLLQQNIRAIYIEGNISTVEMLVSSPTISDYLDKEQYRYVIQDTINDTLDKIQDLENELKSKKQKVDKLIADQEQMQARLDGQRQEQSRLLAMNKKHQRTYNAQIQSNNSEVAELQRLQAEENARLAASGGNSYTAGSGINCGGGYPGDEAGPWGRWGCNYALDNTVDKWGMYNRQCVSYTAFKVDNSGRHMPYWGGFGNAKNWDDNARAAGIPVDYNPRVGDVAVNNSGDYGHVMYIERLGANGDIYVSDYNQQWDGRYREYWISGDTARARGLVYIHF